MMNGTTQKDDDSWKQYHERIDQNFAKTGKRSEIIERTRNQLYQSEWSDEIQEKFAKQVKSRGWNESDITEQQMKEICDAMRDELRRSIPAHIKQDVLASVTDYVDDQIDDIKRDLRRRDSNA